MKKSIRAGILGVLVGDALGVPYEFKSSAEMAAKPATDMVGYGTYNQPPGTWSDDGSLTLCLADALREGYSLQRIAENCVAWYYEEKFAAWQEVFDIGNTTWKALKDVREILQQGDLEALQQRAQENREQENGNGSLMRILPLLCLFADAPPEHEAFSIILEVSAITHRHVRAAMACHFYLYFAWHLLKGEEKHTAFQKTRVFFNALWQSEALFQPEFSHFQRLFQTDFAQLPKEEIRSGGYVIESIEASCWCFLRTENYAECTLSAVNLGHDTDTTAAIAGGLAGIYYGEEGIPEFWRVNLARLEYIQALGQALEEKYF